VDRDLVWPSLAAGWFGLQVDSLLSIDSTRSDLSILIESRRRNTTPDPIAGKKRKKLSRLRALNRRQPLWCCTLRCLHGRAARQIDLVRAPGQKLAMSPAWAGPLSVLDGLTVPWILGDLSKEGK
jgi:hypothetical protein